MYNLQTTRAACTLCVLMPYVLDILLVVLTPATVVLLAYWGIGLARLIEMWRRIPTMRDGVRLAAHHPPRGSICIVVPAHNEEAAIGTLIESLKAQEYADMTVLLCLDRCTDGTLQAAHSSIGHDSRFRIVEVTECAEGWSGKVHAVWMGSMQPEAREADYLLIADADTVFDPACISAAIALMDHRDLDLLSILSTLTADRWFERIVQPAAGLELVRQYPLTRANRQGSRQRGTPAGEVGPPGRRRAFANGQFMLFRREAYDAVGGHEAVRDELLEDIALARRIAEANRPAGVFLADGMVTCRMYDSWDGFRNGWKRIYTESARRKVRRLCRAAVVAMMTGSVLPVAAGINLAVSIALLGDPREPWQTIGTAGMVLSVMALGTWLTVVTAAYRIGRISLLAVPGFVLGSWLVGWILAQAAFDLRARKPLNWGGRVYVRQPR